MYLARFLVVEDVEHAAVDDRVEGQAQVRQPERVTDLEAGHHAPFGRLLPGPPDGEAGHVDADRVRAVGGGQQGLLPRAATESSTRPAAGPAPPAARRPAAAGRCPTRRALSWRMSHPSSASFMVFPK
jgi:hypothetical protein